MKQITQTLDQVCNQFKQELKHYQAKEDILKYIPKPQYVKYTEKPIYNNQGAYLYKTGQLNINLDYNNQRQLINWGGINEQNNWKIK